MKDRELLFARLERGDPCYLSDTRNKLCRGFKPKESPAAGDIVLVGVPVVGIYPVPDIPLHTELELDPCLTPLRRFDPAECVGEEGWVQYAPMCVPCVLLPKSECLSRGIHSLTDSLALIQELSAEAEAERSYEAWTKAALHANTLPPFNGQRRRPLLGMDTLVVTYTCGLALRLAGVRRGDKTV
ncbi:hypothetical protein KIPB_001321 [Kipferlia bialata]|uniref:Uncharacterized protein n=1 Tax=Kipferlia bialata TaxID=797122 RepID=A0A391NTP9_9EUKA|nr:hypothetical protein KIPB_000750 [Kipferlia bialata]GCA62114.1 hypothetical protein KIPB_001321 [Kipferlia bialata]|eukprot:g750.t1